MIKAMSSKRNKDRSNGASKAVADFSGDGGEGVDGSITSNNDNKSGLDNDANGGNDCKDIDSRYIDSADETTRTDGVVTTACPSAIAAVQLLMSTPASPPSSLPQPAASIDINLATTFTAKPPLQQQSASSVSIISSSTRASSSDKSSPSWPQQHADDSSGGCDQDQNKNKEIKLTSKSDCDSFGSSRTFGRHDNLHQPNISELQLQGIESVTPELAQQLTDKDERKRTRQESKQLRRLERRRSRVPVYTYWHALPIDLLERIFGFLSIKERHVASQVCPHWFECFYTPYAWSTFVLTDVTFTKRKYNYYLGYQRIIDPYRTQLFLHRFGHCIRRFIITPMENFYNLYEFMKIISYYAQFFENNPLHNLYLFDFTFGCHYSNVEGDGVVGVPNASGRGPRHRRHLVGEQNNRDPNNNRNNNGEFVFGTGGKLLEALQTLMSQLSGLKHLALRNLLLDPFEAQHLLDDVVVNCHERLRTLTLVNCCKRPFAFLHTGIFLNLETLIISCQHLSEDVLSLLAYTKLRNLYLVQNEFTNSVPTMSGKVWREFRRLSNSKIIIHLALVNNLFDSKHNDFAVKQLVYHQAPVSSIIFDSAYIPIRHTRLLDAIELYCESLECLAFYQLPKFHIIKSYSERADTLLIHLSESCPNLNTLIVRELISTATLLILVTYGRNLTRLLIRRNAIRKRFDCSRNPQWTDEFWNWLAKTSQSYEATFQAVSQKLGYRWQPLTDEQFKRVKPDVNL